MPVTTAKSRRDVTRPWGDEIAKYDSTEYCTDLLRYLANGERNVQSFSKGSSGLRIFLTASMEERFVPHREVTRYFRFTFEPIFKVTICDLGRRAS